MPVIEGTGARPVSGVPDGGSPVPTTTTPAPAQKQTTSTSQPPVQQVSAPPRSGGLTDLELVQVLYQAGFRGGALRTAFAVAKAESGGRPGAHNPNAGTGDNSYGLFQINMLGDLGPARRKQFGLSSNEDLYDPVVNARIAFKMSNGGKTWSPWSVHPESKSRGGKGSGYERHLASADAAIAAAGGEISAGYTGGGFGGTVADGSGVISAATGDITSADVPADDPATDEEKARQLAYEFYGAAAQFYLDHEELGPIILQAVKEKWDQARLVGAITQTKYYQDTTNYQRGQDALKATDRGTYDKQISDRAELIKEEARRLGFEIAHDRAMHISSVGQRDGWSDDQLRRAIVGEFKYDPTKSPDELTGGIGAIADDLTTLSKSYGVPVADQWVANMASRIAAGVYDLNYATEYLKDMARSRFPHLTDHLDRGFTVEQYAEPYKQTYAQMFGKNPYDIDLLSDPKMSKAMDFVDKDGKRRSMTLDEAETFWRAQPEWNETPQANAEYSSLATQLADWFGASSF